MLGVCSRRYAHRIPFIVKLNHNEFLWYPNRYDQMMFASVEQAFDMGAAAVGATIYFGSDESTRQMQEVSEAFEHAHELGLVTVLWCYMRNPAFKTEKADFTCRRPHRAGEPSRGHDRGRHHQAEDAEEQRRLQRAQVRQDRQGVYSDLTPGDHPIELTRYQVANCYMGRIGLINSGGASGANDLADAVRTAVINKRAGGMGLISGRKAFQRPMAEGVQILNLIQDVYLDPSITDCLTGTACRYSRSRAWGILCSGRRRARSIRRKSGPPASRS